MPYISQIVDIINNTLANGKIKDDIRFRKQLHGLAELLPRHINDDQNAIPALVSLTNNITFSGFDDSKSIVVYHRCVETEIIESEFQFGDGLNTAREEARMRMYVFANRTITKTTPQQLSFLLSSGIQQQLAYSQLTNYAGLYGATIEANITNYNSVEIFSNEYRLPATAYPLQPHHIYMALDYVITTDYDLSCIDDCLTC